MKQALSPETPVRVRGQFRAFTLGIGASALAMACSFGQIDDDAPIEDVGGPGTDLPTQPAGTTPEQTAPEATTPGGNQTPTSPSVVAPTTPDFNEDDPFTTTEQGKGARAILETNCGSCHGAGGPNLGDMDYILNVDEMITAGKIVPGDKESSQLYTRMQQGSMPPNSSTQRPTPGQIVLVGQFIDELPPVEAPCTPLPFVSNDDIIAAMAQDIREVDETAQPFTRYMTVTYASNAGMCGGKLQVQRNSLLKGINSVSTNPRVTAPEPIDENETIYRIDIRDYNWDRDIDLEDDDVVDFNDGWDAIVDKVGVFAVEFAGDDADDLKADTGTAVPFLPVNAFIEATETDDLYYTLIGGKANLFDFEKEVLGVFTEDEIADDNLMRAGFSNSGVSEQERVLNRFDSQLGPGYSYWISFDFDGGNGGDNGGSDFNRANESIYDDPLDFAFAGGEAIFNLPNGMQAYYVAAADGKRLGEAPVGVVIDPAQNNGVVINGASCHTCHNGGMITFVDMVKPYVLQNEIKYDNETFESVLAVYKDPAEFQRQMNADSELHISSTAKAGIEPGTADGISRVFLQFVLGNVTLAGAAGELGVSPEILERNLNDLDPSLGNLAAPGAYVDRDQFTNAYTDSICLLLASSDNNPVNCQ